MKIYIINKAGQPLMPTNRCRKIRRLLKNGQAIITKKTPFTVQLLYETTNFVDKNIVLGVDSGYSTIGASVTNSSEELYSSETILRNDIVKLISAKRQNRRTRRNRLRYRAPRFLNRVKSKHKGWLAPSVEQKIKTHLKIIEDICSILPISKIKIETASFDIQKINNDKLSGFDYQNGDQLGFFNVREYVFYRDGYKCKHCKGKSKDKILNVHHIESRQVGGDAPNNLITVCETCHNAHHDKRNALTFNLKRGPKFKGATFMSIMRWYLYNRIKEKYPNKEIHNTYGYITKSKRIEAKLPKSHRMDAYCIAGNLSAIINNENHYLLKKIRCHNRQIHKANHLKGHKKKKNQAPYLVKGYRLFDKVSYKGKEAFIFGRRATGYFDIRTLSGEVISRSIKSEKIKLLEKRKNILIERIQPNSSHS